MTTLKIPMQNFYHDITDLAQCMTECTFSCARKIDTYRVWIDAFKEIQGMWVACLFLFNNPLDQNSDYAELKEQLEFLKSYCQQRAILAS